MKRGACYSIRVIRVIRGQACSDGHDEGIAFVELSERELAVKIERDQKMLARPLHAR
jgi:hypothetical protein